MFERAVLVHYHEIGLKGKNRGRFERRLADNIAFALRGLTDAGVERIASRVLVRVSDIHRLEDVIGCVSRIPGVSYLADVLVTGRDPHDMERAAVLAAQQFPEARTFAMECRRSATDYPERSLEMNCRLGAYVQAETGLGVNLSAPDVRVRVEVVQGEVYTYSRRIEGPGGLPTGVSGTVVSLLSAGIDSPVATWRLMKRGAVVVGVHFSGRPQVDATSERYADEIARVLAECGGMARLYVVPFGDLQREISLAAPPDLRILLYRRLMVRVAEKIATVERAGALVTGESLGQVASQTLDNIAVVDAVATMPVLRPLIGDDKVDIIRIARDIGTYELSIQPHADCCTLFMPRTPETHATVRQVEAGETDLDIERMVADALSGLSWTDYPCPSYKAPKRWPRAEG
ncbi:MAG: tRNA uracil 4-sulfurtransferase ThiI [Coriobacteriia bacterium]|nr:tRNA uracil 4-sulfurtransferase ThiI [Coriobacteriia bacterium]